MGRYRQGDRGPNPLSPLIITSAYRFTKLAGMDPHKKQMEPFGQIVSGRGVYNPCKIRRCLKMSRDP